MSRIRCLAGLAVVGLVVCAVGADGAVERTLDGVYMSSYQDRPQPLRAVFMPSGEATWDVVFHFRFNGAAHEYTGTARGLLGSGELSGRVRNESGARTFTFECAYTKGVCKGTHAELRRNREQSTGSLTLRP